jgi:hypothetical protein
MVMAISWMFCSVIASGSVPRGSYRLIRTLSFSTPRFCQLA